MGKSGRHFQREKNLKREESLMSGRYARRALCCTGNGECRGNIRGKRRKKPYNKRLRVSTQENTLLSYRSHSKPSVEHVTALSAQGPFAISRGVLQSDLQIPT